MPNAWDVGSAVRLEQLGFLAVATTSSGFAASVGRDDQQTTFGELCAHVESVAGSLDVPLSVDGERLFASDLDGLVQNADQLGRLGAAGVSIEDYDPVSRSIDPVDAATERVAAVATVTHAAGMVFTARADNLLYGVDDLDDTIDRLASYARAGADVVYAPGLEDPSDISRVVESVGVPVNVLLRPAALSPSELAAIGVRRASTGGRLAFAAYAAMSEIARGLL